MTTKSRSTKQPKYPFVIKSHQDFCRDNFRATRLNKTPGTPDRGTYSKRHDRDDGGATLLAMINAASKYELPGLVGVLPQMTGDGRATPFKPNLTTHIISYAQYKSDPPPKGICKQNPSRTHANMHGTPGRLQRHLDTTYGTIYQNHNLRSNTFQVDCRKTAAATSPVRLHRAQNAARHHNRSVVRQCFSPEALHEQVVDGVLDDVHQVLERLRTRRWEYTCTYVDTTGKAKNSTVIC